IVAFLKQGSEPGHASSDGQAHGSSNGHAPSNGQALRNGHAGAGVPTPAHCEPRAHPRHLRGPQVARAATARAKYGLVRYYPHASVVTGWAITGDHPGRLRLKNPVLYRKAELCQAIERELMGILGIDQYKTSSLRCTVQIDYDPSQLNKLQIL